MPVVVLESKHEREAMCAGKVCSSVSFLCTETCVACVSLSALVVSPEGGVV